MITKQNYESWFLLYVDNELSADEKAMVLNFVSSNPELSSEFESIQQVKLIPEDAVSMPNKEGLKLGDFVQLENVYRLEPDLSIVYPNRQELYRETPIHSFSKWFPYSAAASVLFIMGLFWWMQRNSTSVEPTIVKSVPVVVESAVNATEELNPIQVIEKPRVNSPYQLVKSKVSKQITGSSESIDPFLVAASEPSTSENEQEIIQPEKLVRVEAQSNFTNEAIEAANERLTALRSTAVAIAPSTSPNMEALIKSAIPQENEGTLFKGLLRKVSRKVFHEEEEDVDVKVVQVANFHIHVKN